MNDFFLRVEMKLLSHLGQMNKPVPSLKSQTHSSCTYKSQITLSIISFPASSLPTSQYLHLVFFGEIFLEGAFFLPCLESYDSFCAVFVCVLNVITNNFLTSITPRLFIASFITQVFSFFFLGVSSNFVKDVCLEEFSAALVVVKFSESYTQMNPDLRSSLYQMTKSLVVDAAVVRYSSGGGSFSNGCELTRGTFCITVCILSQVVAAQWECSMQMLLVEILTDQRGIYQWP